MLKKYSQGAYYGVFFLILLIAPLLLTDFRMGLLAKFLCFAIIAVGLSLIWGFTGILSLGHGVFFGLGAYCMAMYLKLEASPSGLPDFMEWNGITELPFIWTLFKNPFFAIAAAVLLPFCVAWIIGYFTFKNRIKGVFFSLISQAVVVVTVTLFIGSQHITGGTSGLTNFFTVFQVPLADPGTKQILYFITVALLAVIMGVSLLLTKSRFGRLLIAIRDGENRLRFLGYNPAIFKVFIYALSAAFAGIAGALFVLQVGIISPEMMGIIPSIEMVLWVAIGGRYSILGAAIGAILTNGAKSFLSETYPDFWTIFLGGLFLLVVLYLPNGLAGLVEQIKARFSSNKEKKEVKQREADSLVS
ncbi:urea ABC transporter permease subunit UrtC [Metabacillus litoralis]|uniref:Urea ABC transporter permease subunit UrtC n=1 Tax=Metabacillus litoralis TaxID=152268 RepID=A0A5C6W5Z0_9BACI|nr:urea ABC transporter permease subunit UrtC [Metabacillus litoralis]TXC93397.1 urea ABC transporter permease subunit UrtC [Metabacillus litoralis]